MRGATREEFVGLYKDQFQSTRPMRGATHATAYVVHVADVSIHAPHAGRDFHGRRVHRGNQCFNPRAPCGARPASALSSAKVVRFQSTRPMRGATRPAHQTHHPPRVSIHAPHTGRDLVGVEDTVCREVSIHAPHAGRDPSQCSICDTRSLFQSTRPMRGATACLLRRARKSHVSIHAPHAGRDLRDQRCMTCAAGFNPRAPCGARLCDHHANADDRVVSIHAPHAGRDRIGAHRGDPEGVSIHAPHAGRD